MNIRILYTVLLSVVVGTSLTGCSWSPSHNPALSSSRGNQSDTPPADLQAILNPQKVKPDDMSDTQYQMLTEMGKTLGFRGGRAQRARELHNALEARETTLNALYDFRPLLSPEGWLPPVIDEARDVAHITADQIRTSTAVWTIISPERFVSNPPGWRSWLFTGLSFHSDAPDDSVTPENSSQRKVWESAIISGWADGRAAADHILEANFNRLSRDYRGMMLYAMLRRQGMIGKPEVTDAVQTVTGSREKLVTGDRVRRLKEHAGFQLDKTHWRPSVRPAISFE